jgi:deoxyinosine 3'endonuclease (endonuclease V)
VDLTGTAPQQVRLTAGLDVAYERNGDHLAAVVVVVDTTTFEPVEISVVVGTAAFAYVPGLFAFRELPSLVTALERLRVVPDLLVCDGQGIAHPRRFGLACHVEVVTDLPTIGVAKTLLTGTYDRRAATAVRGRSCGTARRLSGGCCVRGRRSNRCSCRWAIASTWTRHAATRLGRAGQNRELRGGHEHDITEDTATEQPEHLDRGDAPKLVGVPPGGTLTRPPAVP